MGSLIAVYFDAPRREDVVELDLAKITLGEVKSSGNGRQIGGLAESAANLARETVGRSP